MSEQVSFDSLLRMAVRETYLQQTNSIPADDKLDEIIHPSDKFEKKMQAMVRRESRNEKLIYFRKITAKVAVVVLLCISLTFGSLLTAKAVRESVATTILEWHDKFTRIFIETDTQPDKLPEIRFNYIPEGFELVEEESFVKSDYIYLTYINEKDYIQVRVSNAQIYDDSNVDNEYMQLYSITVLDNTGMWIHSGTVNKLIIPLKNFFVDLSGTISIEDFIKIYKNIEIL